MTENEQQEYPPLIREDFRATIPCYPIERPEIPSGAAYYFNTESGLRYEVLFAKKKDNYLRNVINFSVLNEEFEDEYSETNRGEIYRVMSTVREIIRIYHQLHAYSTSYEFSGEFKDENDNGEASIRTMLYYRTAKKLLHHKWDAALCGNKVVVSRNRRRND